MELCQKLLSYIIWPRSLIHDIRDKCWVHEADQSLQLIFSEIPYQNFVFFVHIAHIVFWKVENHHSIIIVSCIFIEIKDIFFYPDKKLDQAISQDQLSHGFFQLFCPMFGLVEHQQVRFDFFFDPLQDLRLNNVTIFFMLFLWWIWNHLNLLLLLFSFPWDSVVETLPTLNFVLFILGFLLLHRLNEGLIFFFRNILVFTLSILNFRFPRIIQRWSFLILGLLFRGLNRGFCFLH